MAKQFQVLVASDGSPSANAALAVAAALPWPQTTRATGVVARGASSWPSASPALRAAFERALAAEAQALRAKLARYWRESDVVEAHEPPAAAILSEARRVSADVIALGWRGHGTFRRLLAGSVSRRIAAAAPCPVLVARAAPAHVRRFLIGFDGRPAARRVIRFLARLDPGAARLAVLVNAVEPLPLPQTSRFPRAAREAVRNEIVRINRSRIDQARRSLKVAGAVLRKKGWRVKTQVASGAPLITLLGNAAEWRADILVLGARQTSGLARILLGSVASGALDRSPVPVLIVP